MLWLSIFLSILHTAYSSCPDGFDLVRDGQCRGKYTVVSLYWDEAQTIGAEKCNEIQAQPITIHDEEQQSYWSSRGKHWAFIGIECNSTSKKWKWADGSPIDYKSEVYDAALDADCKAGCSWSIHDDGSWYYSCGHTLYADTDIWCTTQLHNSGDSGDGCDGFEDDSDDRICYQIGKTVENWNDAQKMCKQFGADLASIHSLKENSFVRRLAVSKGVLNGLYLGATTAGKANDFGWIDGTEWDYDNFYAGFPVNGLGSCVVMDTAGSTSGEWVNADCSSSFSAACVRSPKDHVCTKGPWKEGDIITSPGFPFDASIPCDYMFSVDAGKKVELEVSFLEANTCCDHLILYENYIGDAIIANLTGEVSDHVYKTKSSNYMRVSWNPNGGLNVKGMMITFRAV